MAVWTKMHCSKKESKAFTALSFLLNTPTVYIFDPGSLFWPSDIHQVPDASDFDLTLYRMTWNPQGEQLPLLSHKHTCSYSVGHLKSLIHWVQHDHFTWKSRTVTFMWPLWQVKGVTSFPYWNWRTKYFCYCVQYYTTKYFDLDWLPSKWKWHTVYNSIPMPSCSLP